MRDTSETILVAIFGLLGLEFLRGWAGIVVAAFTVAFIIYKFVDMQRRNKREKEKREEEHEKRKEEHEKRKEEHEKRKEEHEKRKEEHEKHELEMKLLKRQLKL